VTAILARPLKAAASAQQKRELAAIVHLCGRRSGERVCAPAAAKRAFDGFIEGRNLSSHQHEFVDMMIEHLTARGVMDPRLLYESPFTDLDPLGVAGVFGEGEVVQLINIFRDVQSRAAA
jgi:hypothetical protein